MARRKVKPPKRYVPLDCYWESNNHVEALAEKAGTTAQADKWKFAYIRLIALWGRLEGYVSLRTLGHKKMLSDSVRMSGKRLDDWIEALIESGLINELEYREFEILCSDRSLSEAAYRADFSEEQAKKGAKGGAKSNSR